MIFLSLHFIHLPEESRSAGTNKSQPSSKVWSSGHRWSIVCSLWGPFICHRWQNITFFFFKIAEQYSTVYHIFKFFHQQWTQVVTGRLTQEQPERQTHRVLYGEGHTFYASHTYYFFIQNIRYLPDDVRNFRSVICIKEIEKSLFYI